MHGGRETEHTSKFDTFPAKSYAVPYRAATDDTKLHAEIRKRQRCRGITQLQVRPKCPEDE